MRNFLCSTMIFWAAPYVACADEMRPLAEVAVNAAAPYAPARCAGLYQAMMEWIGIDRMGDETWETIDTARVNTIMLSALTAQNTNGGTLEHQAELTARDVRNIADLYLARMEANYATGGQAFGEDDVIQSDLTLCKSLTETLQ
jgi:hypothetical protein